MIAADDNVYCSMHLYSGNLGAAKFLHVVDMVNVVVLDYAEDAAHTSDDAALLAMVDVAAADDMAADILLQPAMVLAAAD